MQTERPPVIEGPFDDVHSLLTPSADSLDKYSVIIGEASRVSKDELSERLLHPEPPTLEEAKTQRWPWVGPREVAMVMRGCRVLALTTSPVVSMVPA